MDIAGGGKMLRSRKKTNKKTVEFKLSAPQAKNVLISGDFNKWSQNATSMKKKKCGSWTSKVALSSGRYEYKFIVDGQWWTDPNCKDVVTNSLGSQNSVLVVK